MNLVEVPKLIFLFNSLILVLTLFPLCNSARQWLMVGGLGTLHYLFPVENSQFSIQISISVTERNTTEKQYWIIRRKRLEFQGFIKLRLSLV